MRLIERVGSQPLNVLINNAAQTVKRPPAHYAELARREREALPVEVRGLVSESPHEALSLDRDGLGGSLALRSDSRDEGLFPPGLRDASGQHLDLRAQNSWGQSCTRLRTRLRLLPEGLPLSRLVREGGSLPQLTQTHRQPSVLAWVQVRSQLKRILQGSAS